MKQIFKKIQFLMVGVLFSQTIEIGNTTLNTGGSGVTGTLTTNETYRFQHTVSIGEPFIGTVNLDADGAMSLGQFSFYNQQTNVPAVTASEGDYPDQVKVEWSVDVLQAPIQNGVRIYRNGELKAQFGYGITEWVDENVFPGEIYVYEVQAENRYGWGTVGEADGFVNPNGRITGKIQTSHQTPVYGVEVALEPYFGKTLEFDGEGDFIEVPDFPNDIFTDNTYTIEFWMNVPDHINGFPISKWDVQGANDNTFLINDAGAFLSVGHTTELPELPSLNEWHHLSYVMNDGTLSIYLDSLKVAEETGHHSNATEYSLRMGNYWGGSDYDFEGHLDEIRIWNTARDSAQVIDNMHRVVDSDSDGLVAEWRFDEGIGTKVFDITDASHDGHITGASWSDDNPNIHNSAFTDMDGNYSIRGIYYEPAGTEFTVTPQKVWHEFTPENKTVTLSTSSTASDGVDFMDNSQISVSGYINFNNTSCYEDGVEIKEEIEHEDGTKDTISLQPPVLTDGEGHYIGEFEPGTSHKLIPQFGEHLFTPTSYETGVIIMPQADKNFEDYQTYNLSGSITGGDCRLPLGEEFQVIISTQPSCYDDTVQTYGNGNFTFYNLPARHYEVSVFSENPYYDFTGQQANLTFGNDTIDFVWREDLQLEISGLSSNECDMTILQQIQPKEITLNVFEEYNGIRCYVNNILFTVDDAISDLTEQVQFVFSDSLFDASSPDSLPTYTIVPGYPNFLSGGDYPYQKSITLTVEDLTGREANQTIWAYVEGHKPREQTYSTTAPETPLHILRDPPGDESYMEILEGTTLKTSMKMDYSNEDLAINNFKMFKGTTRSIGSNIMGITVAQTISIYDNQCDFSTNGVSTLTGQEIVNTFTATETFQTSSSEQITGAEGDIFIGAAINYVYGATDVLEIDGCEVIDSVSMVIAPNGFDTYFIYSESHIRNAVIPQLYENLQDTVSAERWMSYLAMNDSLKEASNLIRNISFDGGTGSYEYTETTTSDTMSYSMEFQIFNNDVYEDMGINIGGQGFEGQHGTRIRTRIGGGTTTTNTTTNTVRYVLSDNDIGDYFSVDVKNDPVYGTPTFDLVAGASKCPWEEGTQKRQQVQLTMDGYSAINILPDEDAVFSLYAGNTSESDEEWEYHLRLINNSNPDGAVLKIGGQPLGSAVFPYTISGGEQQTLSLTVERGPDEYDYDSLMIMLYSPCEYDLWGQTGIRMVSELADTIAFSVHFIEPCGGVPEIAYPDDGWVGNSTDSTVFFTINGYNRHDEALSHILMEYQHIADGAMSENNGNNDGEIDLPMMNGKLPTAMENNLALPQGALAMTLDGWFIADTIFVDSLDADYYSWQWDVSFMDDGHYEVRAVGECIDGELNVSEPVAGQLDREPPEIFGEMHPTDGVLNADDEIKLVFEEAIDCEYLFPNQLHLYNESFGLDVAFDYDCFENEIIIVPDVQNMFIENCYLKLTIDELWDYQANHTAQPIVFEFFVDQNPIHWNQNTISDVVYMGEDKTITTTLHNPGTAGSPFVFSGQPWFLDQQTTALPWWIDVNPMQGDLNPGGEYPVEMTISGMLNLGEHEETFYAHTTEGDEPLTVSVRSLCPPPVWELDEQAYQYSMNLTCQVSVKDEISTDDYDFIGAFVDDECRGFAPIEHTLILSEPYDSTWTDDNGIEHTHTFVDTLMNKHLGFMTVHSDAQSGEEVHFRLWDASDCEEYYEIDQHNPFTANSVLGNPENPVVLNATGAVAQFVTMQPGWTWFSVHLNHNEDWLDINHIFSHEEHFTSGDRIVHQDEFETYSATVGEWAPGYMTLNPREMYMAHLDTLTPVAFIGHEISPDSLEITLHPNWNWLGYPLRFNHSINEALQNLSPTDESVIKSETQFAEYMENIGLWVGSLQWMTPGHGYLYESTSDDTLTFTYSGLDAEQGNGLARMIADNNSEPIESPWAMNVKEYRYNMPIVGKPETGAWKPESIVISAIVNDEVRGIAQPVYEPALDDWRIYLMVHSNRAMGETVRFHIYDAETNTEYFTNEIVSFDETRKAGSVANPIPLTKATAVIPDEFVLTQNYPNPFNPTTTIQFGVPDASDVRVHIYDLLGREVITLVNGNLDAGYHTVIWNGKDNFGKSVSSGMYFTVMQSGDFKAVKKMVMLK